MRFRITNQITCCNLFVVDDVMGQICLHSPKTLLLPSCRYTHPVWRVQFSRGHAFSIRWGWPSWQAIFAHVSTLQFVDIHVLSLIGECGPVDPFPFPCFTRQQYKEQESLTYNITRGKIHNLNSRCWCNGVRKLKGLLEIYRQIESTKAQDAAIAHKNVKGSERRKK